MQNNKTLIEVFPETKICFKR